VDLAALLGRIAEPSGLMKNLKADSTLRGASDQAKTIRVGCPSPSMSITIKKTKL
jgi:hypothetical protein